MKLLVVIPCLNEEATLASVIARIPRNIPGCSQVDVLVVDDGSTDRSAQVARDSGAEVISHKFNMGVGQAFHSALEYALDHGYTAMLNIDADGQFAPEQIPLLLRPIIDGKAEFVTGSRFMDGKKIAHMSAVKRWGNDRMTRLISRLTGQKFTDVSCGFRAYSRKAMLRLNLHGQFTYTQETFLNLAFNRIKISEVPIEVKYFPDRKSRVAGSLFQYAIRTSNIIFRTYRDYRPLRFFWSAGMAFLLPAIGFIGFLFGWWLYAGKFSPHIWAGFVGGSLFFIATALFIVGMLADMLGRIRKNQEDILYAIKKLEV